MQTRNINKSILITGGDARIDIGITVILLFLNCRKEPSGLRKTFVISVSEKNARRNHIT
jgi:hypothetical protein